MNWHLVWEITWQAAAWAGLALGIYNLAHNVRRHRREKRNRGG